MEDPNYHMGNLFLDIMRKRPNAVCQIDAATGEEETNASVLTRSVRLARCFIQYDLKPGDVLALGGRNHLDLHIPHYAALMTGLPVVGVDPLFKGAEIKSLFKLAQPRIAFCQVDQYDYYIDAVKALGLETKIITFDVGEHSLNIFLEKFVVEESTEDFEPIPFDTSKVYAWLISSGGTTGVVKLAAFRHRTFIDKLLYVKQFFTEPEDENLDYNKPALYLSPVQWVSAFSDTLRMPVMNQCRVQTSAPATTEHVIDIINKYKPETAVFGPSMAESIIRHKKECDFTCFNIIMLSSGKIHKNIIIEIKKRLRKDAVVMEAYGQSENMGPALMPNPFGPIGSCGINFPLFPTKLVDPETEQEINEPNVAGELWTKGMRFEEYYNDPETTAKVITKDGWYKTGDILYRDENENYFFVERISLLIKYRNYHVHPSEIEEVIRGHPSVLEVCVTSVPHAADGEWPIACVVPRSGTQLDPKEIEDLVASELSETKLLRGGVIFLEEIPLTSAGKIAQAKLKQIAINVFAERNKSTCKL